MKIITANKITEAVKKTCIKANIILRADVLSSLRKALESESNKRARGIIKAIIDNAGIARKESLAICQDTGMPVVFVELGDGVSIKGDLRAAINKGVELGYKEGSLRNSIVQYPIKRGVSSFTPAVIHTEIVKGKRVKITVLPKGFGCENKSQLKMFKPTAEIDEIKKFIVDAVKSAGPDACPPYVVGVGIGGTADYACLLAKKALLKKVKGQRSKVKDNSGISKLESELRSEINKLNIGPMGLGGKITCLAVNIETYPTHIAGLPVAVNISCHALRSASVLIY